MNDSNLPSCKPVLSVVLVSFNTCQLTLDCLSSLMPSLSPSDEIFVVDNASKDGSVEAIRRLYPMVHVIANQRNLGYGAANNLAFRECSGEYILLLNTDTLVQLGALQAMKDVLIRDKSVAAVGCRLENWDGSLQRSCWSFPSPFQAWSEALGINRIGIPRDWHRWAHDVEQDVDFVIGAAMMVRAQVVKETGGFDEDFFLYAEETDWQLRMKKSGWKIRFTPDGTVTHLGGASGATMKQKQIVEFCRSNARFVRKHYGQIGLLSVRIAKILGLMIRIPPLAIMAMLKKAKAKDRYVEKLSHLLWWLGLGERRGFSDHK